MEAKVSRSGGTGTGNGESGAGSSASGTLAPSVNFVNLPYKGTIGTAIKFEATTSNFTTDTLIFNWNFGDGNSTTTDIPFVTHTYNATGIFTLILSVQGGDKSASISTSVEIKE
jgi:hypothetical protein